LRRLLRHGAPISARRDNADDRACPQRREIRRRHMIQQPSRQRQQESLLEMAGEKVASVGMKMSG